MAKSRLSAKCAVIRVIIVYGTACLACAALYWAIFAMGTLNGMIMGYTLLVLYCILPIAGALSAFLVGRSHALGWRRFAAPFATAAFFVLFVAATFGLSTMLGFSNIACDYFGAFMLGFVPAMLGLAMGLITA